MRCTMPDDAHSQIFCEFFSAAIVSRFLSYAVNQIKITSFIQRLFRAPASCTFARPLHGRLRYFSQAFFSMYLFFEPGWWGNDSHVHSRQQAAVFGVSNE